MSKEHTEKEWMQLCRGIPAGRVATILSRYCGVSYRGVGKREMAEVWVEGGGLYGGKLHDREGLRKDLQEEPRETAADKEARKANIALNKRANSVITYIENKLPDELVHGLSVMREKDLPAELFDRALEILSEREESYRRQINSSIRWLCDCSTVRAAIESLMPEEEKP